MTGMRIFAIDPGNIESGFAVVDTDPFTIIEAGKVANGELYRLLLKYYHSGNTVPVLAIEMIASYGMAVGKEVFETCVWIGRIKQFIDDVEGDFVQMVDVFRKDEKMLLCGSMKAKDANIRQALIDKYAKHDLKNGKGTKKDPDVFYGFKADMWSAVAVACVAMDKCTEGDNRIK